MLILYKKHKDVINMRKLKQTLYETIQGLMILVGGFYLLLGTHKTLMFFFKELNRVLPQLYHS
jgi:hypothetical protein